MLAGLASQQLHLQLADVVVAARVALWNGFQPCDAGIRRAARGIGHRGRGGEPTGDHKLLEFRVQRSVRSFDLLQSLL